MNRTLRGWANYFNVGTVTKAYRALDNYAAVRVPAVVAHQAQGQATQGRDLSTLAISTGIFGLVRLGRLGHDVPWVKA